MISSDSGGGLSVKEPLRGPLLLCESRPDVLGDTSCCKKMMKMRQKENQERDDDKIQELVIMSYRDPESECVDRYI